jgi:hypothetical protein
VDPAENDLSCGNPALDLDLTIQVLHNDQATLTDYNIQKDVESLIVDRRTGNDEETELEASSDDFSASSATTSYVVSQSSSTGSLSTEHLSQIGDDELSVLVPSDDTIEYVKQKIQDKEGLPSSQHLASQMLVRAKLENLAHVNAVAQAQMAVLYPSLMSDNSPALRRDALVMESIASLNASESLELLSRFSGSGLLSKTNKTNKNGKKSETNNLDGFRLGSLLYHYDQEIPVSDVCAVHGASFSMLSSNNSNESL